LRRIAGGAALRHACRHPGAGDPDRIEIADHLPEPVRGARADARTRAASRDHRQRPAAHGARAAPVPPAGHRRAGLADAEHPPPRVARTLGVPRARGLFLPSRLGGPAAVGPPSRVIMASRAGRARQRSMRCTSTATASMIAPPNWYWATTPRSI